MIASSCFLATTRNKTFVTLFVDLLINTKLTLRQDKVREVPKKPAYRRYLIFRLDKFGQLFFGLMLLRL